MIIIVILMFVCPVKRESPARRENAVRAGRGGAPRHQSVGGDDAAGAGGGDAEGGHGLGRQKFADGGAQHLQAGRAQGSKLKGVKW